MGSCPNTTQQTWWLAHTPRSQTTATTMAPTSPSSLRQIATTQRHCAITSRVATRLLITRILVPTTCRTLPSSKAVVQTVRLTSTSSRRRWGRLLVDFIEYCMAHLRLVEIGPYYIRNSVSARTWIYPHRTFLQKLMTKGF